jgi:hypothetical protein
MWILSPSTMFAPPKGNIVPPFTPFLERVLSDHPIQDMQSPPID